MLIQSLLLNLHATLSPFVIQSEAKDLGNILYAIEILPPYGRLNDKTITLLLTL